jgi:transitional endoplasmic reticulum ATPase
MDHETLQALIGVYRTRANTDLLSIIMDEAEGPQAQATVQELLRSISAELLSSEEFAPVRRKACQFCLNANDFELAERLARGSDLPQDRVMRARALLGLGREQEAVVIYRQAIAKDPAIRNRELERMLGIRPSIGLSAAPAKVISLNTYSRRQNKPDNEAQDRVAEAFLDDFGEAGIAFGDVAGLADIKAEIRNRIVLPYLKPTLFERYKQKAGGNLLLYGPPGCGKTLIARAVAGESDARFLSVNPEEILDKYTGEPERRLRTLFDDARSDTPAILFFDNFDALAFRRIGYRAGIAPALVSVLTSELDGTIHNNSGLFIIAATNAPWLLESNLLHPGVFQRVMYVPPPPLQERLAILKRAVAGVPGHDKISFDRIGRKCAGFSGSDLLALADWACNSVLTKALAGAPDASLTTALLEDGLKLFKPSTADWLTLTRAEIKSMKRQETAKRLFAPIFRGRTS